MSALLPTTPLTAADVSADWIAMVRGIAQRDGHAVRAGSRCMIEVQSINEPERWGPLMLPNSGTVFATDADRDAVLRQIHQG